jgi:hypothetical protein
LPLPKSEKVNAKVVSERLSELRIAVAERTVRSFVGEAGCPVEVMGSGLWFLWPDFVGWYLERERRKAREDAKPKDSAGLELREQAAKTRKIELELAEMEGELVTRTGYREEMEWIVAQFKASLLGLPPLLAPKVCGEPDLATVQTIIKTEVHKKILELQTLADVPVDDDDSAAA